jgi:hypothetical protein
MYQKKEETRTLNDFHETLKLLSYKLNKDEYSFVAGVLFRCLMGTKFGYHEHDQRILQDIHSIWVKNRDKIIKSKKKIFKLKVVKGGKTKK